MDATEILNLPYLLPSQAQKHVSHNEALRALDAIIQLSVMSRNASAPPALAAAGDRYIVPAEATGVWTGHDHQVAARQDGLWMFYAPRPGWLAYVLDEQILLAFDGAEWGPAVAAPAFPDRLGLNTLAEAPNRLAVAGVASLFTHEGTGHQLKVNKAASADTASVLFQRDYLGRAELGLVGDDNFHIKVSADGISFVDALLIDRNSGRATFPGGVTSQRQQLTADHTYHVAPVGSDFNDGLSTTTAFATVQKAVDEAHKLDCSIYNVTIRIADGIYAGAAIERPLFGGGVLFLSGNDDTPSAVVLTTGLTVRAGAAACVSGMKFEITTDWKHALAAEGSARLRIGKIEFGSIGVNADHISAQSASQITFEQDYVISGGARRHISAEAATVTGANRAITLTGMPAFSQFIFANDCASVSLWNLLISGGATGSRFYAGTNGAINLFGKPIDYLPGSVAGTIESGGVVA